MLVDGKAIAEELIEKVATDVAALSVTPKLGIVTCSPGLETRQYLKLKKRTAKRVGIDAIVLELPEEATTEDCIACVNRLAEECHGVLVQLPLPPSIDREQVLDAIPVSKDPDGFAYARDERSAIPPVAAAIAAIANTHTLSFTDKQVTVVGFGRLVGQPAARYIERAGGYVTVLTEDSEQYAEHIKAADVLVTGVGQPHFITPAMVKDGVVVFDAGASEDGGVVVGDVDPAVAEKATLFSPVPGGIGPITVAALLDNLIQLIRE